MTASVLVIAGSDPGGGAGIQADIKTINSLGVYVAAAITCVTVQGSGGIRRAETLPPDLVRDQITAVLNDQVISHVKIGMLGNATTVSAVAEALAGFTGEVIIDPMLNATSGGCLLAPEAVDVLWRELLPLATVLTPNLPELEALTNTSGLCDDAATEAAVTTLFQRLPRLRVVVVKDGHGSNPLLVRDRCWYRKADGLGHWIHEHTRHPGHNTHGTGCTFASAFAATHCLSNDDRQSFLAAVTFMDWLIGLSQNVSPLRDPTAVGPLSHHRLNAS
ncbi:MAG: hypothetical protein BWK76_20175 [Desulfobulbaceae bacterium A2]|nr:MAG: hypothetical protein BWK76_20175 [Desulfobulbaceae bacterium A2]